MDNKFKVGDEVIVISESYEWGSVGKGDVGKITRMIGKNSICVKFLQHDGWHCKAKDLKHKQKTLYITYKEYLKLKK